MRRPTSSGNRLRHPSTWTLRSKLVASTVAMFIAITLATGVTTILALNTFLTSQLDAQVTASAGRAAGGDDHDRALRLDGGTRAARPDGPPPGLGGGFLLLEVTDGTATTRNAARTPSGQDASLTPAQVGTVLRAGVGQRPKTGDLGGELGSWRLVANPSRIDPGATVVTGLPMGPQHDTVERLPPTPPVASARGVVLFGPLGGGGA